MACLAGVAVLWTNKTLITLRNWYVIAIDHNACMLSAVHTAPMFSTWCDRHNERVCDNRSRQSIMAGEARLSAFSQRFTRSSAHFTRASTNFRLITIASLQERHRSLPLRPPRARKAVTGKVTGVRSGPDRSSTIRANQSQQIALTSWQRQQSRRENATRSRYLPCASSLSEAAPRAKYPSLRQTLKELSKNDLTPERQQCALFLPRRR